MENEQPVNRKTHLPVYVPLYLQPSFYAALQSIPKKAPEGPVQPIPFNYVDKDTADVFADMRSLQLAIREDLKKNGNEFSEHGYRGH